MIAYLEGLVLGIDQQSLILQTKAGVGYQLVIGQNILRRTVVDSERCYYIHTYVREGEISLYGFESLIEKQIFEILIRTSGVGPKLALAILSQLSPEELVKAIQDKDLHAFHSISGVGKKTATKICLDVGDQLKKLPSLENLLVATEISDTASLLNSSSVDDLISGLTNMGFAEKDVVAVARQAASEGGDLEGQIKKALALMSVM